MLMVVSVFGCKWVVVGVCCDGNLCNDYFKVGIIIIIMIIIIMLLLIIIIIIKDLCK